jgi:hypothetical protein
MIKTISIEHFKSFEQAKLELGRVNLLIGTNSSGKSNFFDSLRVLQGLSLGLTMNEVLNGVPKNVARIDWPGIRGGSQYCGFMEKDTWTGNETDVLAAMRVDFEHGPSGSVGFEVSFWAESAEIETEALYRGSARTSQTGNHSPPAAAGTRRRSRVVDSSALGVSQLLTNARLINELLAEPRKFDEGQYCESQFRNMLFFEPWNSCLRSYASVPVKRMAQHGENFAGLVKSILEVPELHEAYVGWLREMLPSEVEEVKVLQGALGDPLFALRDNGRDFPAPILSDGTLRFAALAAAFFQPEMPGLLALEEIEDGIHPTRLRLLLDLLSSQSESTNTQVFATTHSPLVVEWARAFGGVKVFHFARNAETHETQVRELNLAEVGDNPLGELMSEGWLEVRK